MTRLTSTLLALLVFWTACAVWPGASEPIKLAGLLGFLAMLCLRGRLPAPPPVLWIWLLVTLCATLAALDGISWMGTQARAQGWVAHVALVVLALAAATQTADQRRTLAVWIVGLAAMVSAYALLQRFGLDPVNWVGAQAERPATTLSNANVLAGWLLLSIPITAWLALAAGRRGVLLWSALGLQLGGLWASGTRSAMLALLLVVLLLWGRQHPRRLLGGGLALLMALAIAVMWRPASIHDRLSLWSAGTQALIGAPLVDLRGQADRLAHWRPWIGYGPDQQATPLQRALAQQPRRDGTQDWQADRAHQGVLDLLLQSGLIGLLAACWLLLTVLAALAKRRAEPEALAIAAALLAWMVHLQAGFPLTADRTLAWLLIGWALAPGLPAPGQVWRVACVALAPLLAAAALAQGGLGPARHFNVALEAEHAFAEGQRLYALALQRRGHEDGFRDAAAAFVAELAFRPYDRDAALAAASAYAESAVRGGPGSAAAAARLLRLVEPLDPSDPRLPAIRARLGGVDSRDSMPGAGAARSGR